MKATRVSMRIRNASIPLLVIAAAVWVPVRSGATENPDDPTNVLTDTLPSSKGRVTAEQRPFVYLEDPSTPSKGVFAIGYGIGFGSGISADRPIPVALQKEGVTNSLSLGYGLTSWLEPIASVNVNTNTATHKTATNAVLGAKVQLTNPESPWRLAALGGTLREGLSGSWGAWLRAAGSFGAGPLLVEANGYAERIFASGRDEVDVTAMLGASYRLLPALRVGAEFVGQDLEEALEDGAEDGARMGLGPDIAIDLAGGRWQLVVASLFGLNSASPTAIVSAGVLGSF